MRAHDLRTNTQNMHFFVDGFPNGIDDQILTAAHSKLHELERSSLSLACVFVSESGAELVNG